jgi:ATP-dependent RNA helicase RhlB
MSATDAATESSLAPTAEPQEGLPFDSLSLPDAVRRGIAGAGFSRCTPIQEKVLPLSLVGRDVAGQAQTGTGKTAAFLITVFSRLLEQGHPRRPAAPRALVIAPTRELVVQIASDAELLGAAGMGLVVQAVYGGVDYKKQRENLRQDVDLLVGTPGRLIDYWKQRVYDLRAIEMLVIDEADRMFDMGFIKDLRFLLRRCPPVEQRQSMLFSATLSHDVMELAYLFMNEAVRLEVKPEQVTAEGIDHRLYHVGKHEKAGFLLWLLQHEGSDRTLIFCNMRRTADHLCRTLTINGFPAEQITGDIEQRKRLRILEDFKEGRLPILVATDVASRGLHIEGVTHVINYDLPFDAEDYVHRAGRTARAGATGTAISLACEDYVDGLEAMEKLIGFRIPHEFPDDTMIAPVTPAPRLPRRRLDHAAPRGGRRPARADDRPRSGASHPPGAGFAPSPVPVADEAAARSGRPPARGSRRAPPGGRAHAPASSVLGLPAGSAEVATSAPESAGESATVVPRKRRRRRRRRASGKAGPTGGSPVGGDAGGGGSSGD